MTAGSTSALTFVPIEQYLRTNYRPDVEYIDGELKEKPLVMSVHGRLQVLLGSWFDQHEGEWQVLAAAEVRTRVAKTRVRLPELMVDHARSWPQTLVEPPLVGGEVFPPTDSDGDIRQRIADYLAMGIKTVG